MWVRSQDKNLLIKCDNFSIEHYTKTNYTETETTIKFFSIETLERATQKLTALGDYSTKEKALRVLDMIQKFIGVNDVFQMPQDDEVK